MAKRIKVCYVINSFSVGGAETVVLNLCRKLPSDKFEVTVVSVLEKTPDQISIMRQRFIDAKISTKVMNLGNIRNPISFLKLWLFFKKSNFDVVHGHNRPSDWWCVVVGRYAGVRNRLWTRHLVYNDMSKRQLKQYSSLEKEISVVFAVSESVRENCISYEKIPESKVITVENGIDTEIFSPLGSLEKREIRSRIGCPDDAEMIVFVGRLAEQKAPEGFVSLIQKMRSNGRNVHGFLCGAGPLLEELQGMLIPDCGIHFLGLRNDIPAILSSADLFVSTSRNEGLPLNVMEAMSVGTPIVGPRLVQISCLFNKYPELSETLFSKPPVSGPIQDNQIDDWAKTVESFLNDPDRMERSGRLGREIIIENFSLDKMVKSYSSLYQEY